MRNLVGLVLMVGGGLSLVYLLWLPTTAQPGFEEISYLIASPFILLALVTMAVGFGIRRR